MLLLFFTDGSCSRCGKLVIHDIQGDCLGQIQAVPQHIFSTIYDLKSYIYRLPLNVHPFLLHRRPFLLHIRPPQIGLAVTQLGLATQ